MEKICITGGCVSVCCRKLQIFNYLSIIRCYREAELNFSSCLDHWDVFLFRIWFICDLFTFVEIYYAVIFISKSIN